MEYPLNRYKAQAAAAFYSVLELVTTWTNGWQVGNVFDTLTDCVVRYPEVEPRPRAVIETVLERWASIQGSMCWYDDWGWWGIASTKAFDDKYAGVFDRYRKEFQGLLERYAHR